jgi:predicted small lipoprotein YifL
MKPGTSRCNRLSRGALIVIVAAGTALAGCGQKGNLYLPNQKKKVPATQPQPNAQPQPEAQPTKP